MAERDIVLFRRLDDLIKTATTTALPPGMPETMNTITADPVAHQVSQQLQRHNEYQIGIT